MINSLYRPTLNLSFLCYTGKDAPLMGWEIHGGHLYNYRNERQGRRVISTYWGRGNWRRWALSLSSSNVSCAAERYGAPDRPQRVGRPGCGRTRTDQAARRGPRRRHRGAECGWLSPALAQGVQKTSCQERKKPEPGPLLGPQTEEEWIGRRSRR